MKQKSFTLIELLVVVAVFSIIITVLMGIFVSTIRTQRYSLVYQQMIDQSSYAMEYMSRFLRMAARDTTGDCINTTNYWTNGTPPGTEIRFKNYKPATSPQCQKFYLKDEQIYQGLDFSGAGWLNLIELPITSNKFKVTSLQFLVAGQDPNDTNQPRVTILLEIEGKNISPAPKLKIQTTISQRNLDF